MGHFCQFVVVLSVFLVNFLLITAEGEDQSASWNFTYTDILKKDLLQNYDKYARPEHHEHPTYLNVSLTLRHFDLDETKSVLSTHAWLKLWWTDSKLKWDPAKYGNLSVVHVGDHEIWQPDLTLYNSAAGSAIDHYGNTHCLVYNTGTVLWVPPTKFESFCELDLKHWPFDVQKCQIIIGSWTYSGFQINITTSDPDIEVLGTMQNTEWKVIDHSSEVHSKYYACCAEPYYDVTFYITIQRASSMYKCIVVTPAILVIFMVLVSFWLPPHAGEKILLNGISCLVICILLMYFSQLLPVLAQSTPLIVRFYSYTLYLIAISFVISVIVINFARNKKQYGVSKFVKDTIINGKIGSILGSTLATQIQGKSTLEKSDEEASPNDRHTFIEEKPAIDHQHDWIHFAIIIDRITFVIYLIIFIIFGLFHYF